jgi:TP901 family phage tail tape measure protein
MASGTVRGITIEIEGKTSGLVKSLKSVNSSLKSTQQSLKVVNQALKLDPKNVNTLKTKQELLNTAIEQTEEKLKLEQQAAEDAAKALEEGTITKDQYNTLQAEVAKTASELENLKSEAEATNKELDNLGSGSKLSSLGSELEAVGGKLQGVGDKMTDIGDRMTKFGAQYTATVTTPIVAGGKKALDAFNEVDGAMDTLIKKTGATGPALEEMEGIVANIATEIPIAFDTAGEAVGEISTRFGLTGEALESLSKQFIEFAELNDTDVSSSIDSVQKGLAAFGLESDHADELLDSLNATVQKYGVNVDSLTSGLVQNGTAFQEMGLTIEQSVDLMGQLETSGANSETVMNGLRKALKNATADGIPMNEALADLQNTIENGTDSMDGLTASYDLFGKSGDQIYGAVKNGTLDFRDLADTLEDTSGSVDDTYEATLDGADKMQTAMNSVKLALADVGESIGETLAPMLEDLSEKLKEVKEWWGTLSDEQKQFIIKAAMVVAAIGPIIMVIGTLISSVGSITSGIGGLVGNIGKLISGFSGAGGAAASAGGAVASAGGSIASVALPIIGVIAAIGALIAIFVHLYQTNEDFKNDIDELWSEIKDMFAGVFEAIQELFSAFIELVSAIWDEWGDDIMMVTKALVEFLVNVIKPALDIIIAIVKMFTALVKGDTEGFCDALEDLVYGLCELIVNRWNGLWDAVAAILVAAVNILLTLFQTLSSAISAIWEGIKTFLLNIWTAITTAIATAVTAIWTKVTTTFESIKNAIIGKFEAAKAGLIAKAEAIKTSLSNAWDNIKSGVTSKFEAIKSAIQNGINSAVDFIKNLPSQALTWGRDLMANFISGISGKLGDLRNKVSSVASTVKSYIGFSEPEKGPLSNFHTYAPDMMELFSKGITDNIWMVQDAVTGVGTSVQGGFTDRDYTSQLAGINNSIGSLAAAGGGTIVIPVNIGGTQIDRLVVDATKRSNFRSGGR